MVKEFIQAATSSSPASFSFPILKALTICSVPGSQGREIMECNEITLLLERQVEGDEGFSNDFRVVIIVISDAYMKLSTLENAVHILCRMQC